ncbi:universal stress protein [Streptomyces griseus]|uniref:universal stress protein n=1 Tax=Streptomyces griseus TaxID=1911 RepID=UPI00084015C3|nr:universal stress protein [Streptomyces griseus]
MSRTVTAGIDGSREGLAAADWAAGEALIRGCPLRLVHVWRDDDPSAAHYADLETRRRSAEGLLHEAAGQLRRDHPELRIETEQKAGAPVEELRAVGDRSEILVLGSRGLGSVKGFVVGSVSLAVLARVRCPLVLVRAGAPDGSAPPPSAGDVIVGLDLPGTGREDHLAFAFAAAERYGCGLRAVHSWSLPPMYGPGTTDVVPVLMQETAEARRKEMDAALTPWTAAHPGVRVSRECVQGHPAQILVDSSPGARLVVVGLRQRASRLGGHVGPVVHSVLHHTAAPVAVVPHG